MSNIETTIKVFRDEAKVWKSWCKHYKKSSAEMMKELMRRVKLKQQEAFYLSLPPPEKIVKPLDGVRIQKKYTKK